MQSLGQSEWHGADLFHHPGAMVRRILHKIAPTEKISSPSTFSPISGEATSETVAKLPKLDGNILHENFLMKREPFIDH
jgi:hypothetical protein